MLVLPGKGSDPALEESTRFKFILLGNLDHSHQPVAVITFSNGPVTKVSSYRFHPKHLADVLDRKIPSYKDTEPTIRTEFQTPVPMSTRSFKGPVSLVQEFNNGETAICRLFFRGSGKDGVQHALHVNLATDPNATDNPVVHGMMALQEGSRASSIC